MLQTFADTVALYDYTLPPGRIAQAPASPRDSAKLLVYKRKTKEITWSTVRDLVRFLPPKCVLVLNETKVIPARLPLTRATGGRVAILYLRTEGKQIRALSNKRLKEGEFLHFCTHHPVILRPERPRCGQCGIGFTVAGVDGKEWILNPTFPVARMQSVLFTHGVMPLPPYIKHSPLTEKELRTRYQTVFAKKAGSIAAPTASLHFTDRLLRELSQSGITIARVTLHVHLGTFAPLTEAQWTSGKLHQEHYEIPAATQKILAAAKTSGRPIIAAGTTVARTLESSVNAQGQITRPKGETQLFIKEGDRFRIVDGLLTNFHVPKSSLLMLVSALTGREELLDLYAQAIGHDFRFFSFGDAMLVI